jgi:hypothetical protein
MSLLRIISHSNAVGLAAMRGTAIKAHEIVGSAVDPAANVTNTVLTVKQLLSPLSREEIKYVRCLGLNYADHAVRRSNYSLSACSPSPG